ncbi:DNA/RNA nuclease SfsA [Thiohalocapsa sp.]|uniref:DNA/RNA nuclease SfsA n=1 Tax=Thiohalocapsa sp. TaxID=2497641 RepID=UPI00345B7E8A
MTGAAPLRLPGLHDGRILARPNRFVAEVALAGGERVTAHVPNTGTLMTCWRPGAPVQLTRADNPRRKLAWTLERVDMGGGWIGVNTLRPNQVMAEGIAAGRIPALAGYGSLRREVPFAVAGGHSGRIDIGLDESTLSPPRAPALVEVKNVTLLDGGCLRFPDAQSERGRKHLELLTRAVESGRRGVMLFALNRPEGERFAPAWDIDPRYGEALLRAAAAGVELLAVRMLHQVDGIVTGAAAAMDLTRP